MLIKTWNVENPMILLLSCYSPLPFSKLFMIGRLNFDIYYSIYVLQAIGFLNYSSIVLRNRKYMQYQIHHLTDCFSPILHIVNVKPQSDIHCNRCATSPRPKFKTIAEVAEESQLGFAVGRRLVGDWSATLPGPVCDQISRNQSFEHVQKPGCDWFGRSEVADFSATSPGPIGDLVATSAIGGNC